MRGLLGRGFHCVILTLAAAVVTGCDARTSMSNRVATSQSNPRDTARAASREGPAATVGLFVKWDSAGRWVCVHCDPVYDSARTELICPVDSPCAPEDGGGDLVWVVSGYHLRTLSQDSDSAAVEMTYALRAFVYGGHVTPADSQTRTWRFVLNRSEGRWRIDGASLTKPPAVSSAYALRKLVADSVEREGLRALVGQ